MNWRALLAAGVFVALLVAGVLIARRSQAPDAEAVQPAPQPEPTPVLPAAPPPLTRGDLIDAAARAADAYALGSPAPQQNAEIVGRRFALRLPFGCGGQAGEDSTLPAQWSYNAEEGTLRAGVAPVVFTDAGFLRAIAGAAEFEAAEGFLIARPWIRSGECPRHVVTGAERPSPDAAGPPAPTDERPQPTSGAAQSPAAPAVRETLALIELFAPGSPRAGRRNGRPYELVARVAPGEIDLSRGLRVAIEGRVAALVGNQPIVCQAESSEVRPLCLIGADIERIAVTDASGERVLAEWAD